MKLISRHLPSPAMIVACIALTVALGGTGYAAIRLPANSVGTKQLKKKAVTSPKVKDNSLTGADIRESTLGSVPQAANATLATTATNATNATHATSADSAVAATGLPGPLASLQTLRGTFGLAGHKDAGGGFVDEVAISFPIPLAASPTTFDVVPVGGPPTANCPGTLAAPSALAGHLCLYENELAGATGISSGLVSRFGASIFPSGVANGANYETDGTWAVTAP
jgi:hypothetical protein